ARLHRARCGRSQRLRATKAEDDAGAQSNSFHVRPPEIRKLRSRIAGVVVVCPNVVDLEQAPGEPLSERKIQAAAKQCANPVGAVAQTAYIQTVVTQQSMHEVVSVVRSPYEAWAARDCGYRVGTARAVSKIEFTAPVGVKVVSNRGAKSLRHIRHLVWGGIVGIAERHRDARMRPLIAHKPIPLRGGIALREGRTGNR